MGKKKQIILRKKEGSINAVLQTAQHVNDDLYISDFELKKKKTLMTSRFIFLQNRQTKKEFFDKK